MDEKKSSLVSLILSGIFLILAITRNNNEWANLFWGGFIGTGSVLFISLGVWFLNVRTIISIIFQSAFVSRLRLSCAYLYRIKVDDHYLLIKSRKHGKFQPVGGNFKKNEYSNAFLKQVEEDDKIQSHEKTIDDLRLYISGNKFLRFLNWYNSPKREREITYDREFYEELVEPEILPNKLFPYPVVNFLKQIISPVTYSQHFQCYEIHIYDIVELVPTTKQLKYLREMKKKGDTETIKWATIDVIRNEGYQGIEKGSPYHITDHSRIITDLKITKKIKK